MEELIYFLGELIIIGGIILGIYCGFKTVKLEKEKNPEYKKYFYILIMYMIFYIVMGAIFSYILTSLE
jgi:prolipoprotein diacylglyceryltransferase